MLSVYSLKVLQLVKCHPITDIRVRALRFSPAQVRVRVSPLPVAELPFAHEVDTHASPTAPPSRCFQGAFPSSPAIAPRRGPEHSARVHAQSLRAPPPSPRGRTASFH